jgi:hypothetical protein
MKGEFVRKIRVSAVWVVTGFFLLAIAAFVLSMFGSWKVTRVSSSVVSAWAADENTLFLQISKGAMAVGLNRDHFSNQGEGWGFEFPKSSDYSWHSEFSGPQPYPLSGQKGKLVDVLWFAVLDYTAPRAELAKPKEFGGRYPFDFSTLHRTAIVVPLPAFFLLGIVPLMAMRKRPNRNGFVVVPKKEI